jgi:hypothetical protein
MLDQFRRRGFHPSARQSMTQAKYEASRAGLDRIRSEHVLLGALTAPGPAADAAAAAGIELTDLRARLSAGNGAASGPLDSDALSSVGIDLDAIRRSTDAAFGTGALDRAGSSMPRRLRFSDDGKRVIVGAVREADALGQREIGTGHLLLGVLDHQPSTAVMALTEGGADLAALRADVLRRIAPAA